MTERLPPAEIPESYFVDLLRNQPESPEVQAQFRAWCEQELSKDLTPRGRIEHDIRVAKIYRSAGQLRQAWENLDHICYQALQEGLQDLHDAAMAIMDDIDARGS